MVDIPRLGDEASGSKRLHVATLTELGELALKDVGERGTLFVAVKASDPSRLERDRAQTELIAGEIGTEIDRALDLGVESLVLRGRALLTHG
jgi:hypothetical protein